MKKQVCFLLVVCMLLVLVTGCTNGKNTQSTASTTQSTIGSSNTESTKGTSSVTWDIKNVSKDFPFDQYVTDEKAKWNLGRNVSLDWYHNVNFHYTTKPWTEYTALKTVADITGITVTGQIPTGDPTEKVNLMMATNSLPDMVTLGIGDPLGQNLIDGGYVLCLEDLLKQYEPEFWETMPEDLKRINTREDGKMWSISGCTMPEWQYKDKYGIGGHGYNVRKDLWMELGSPSIATPDDLYNVLKQFKQKYPTLNGKTSIGISGYDHGAGMLMTMGFSFGIDAYFSTFDTGTYYDEKTEKCTVKFLNPNYPDFIAYMNKLYREGLIDPEVFIKDTQKNVEDMSTCAFMMPYVFWAADPANSVLNAANPESHFIAIEPMSATGKPYRAASGQSRLGAYDNYVSKKCKDPEAVARLIAYGFSPAGTMQLTRGNPGQHWLSENGVYQLSDEVVDAYKVDSNAYNMKHGLWDYYALMYAPMPSKPTDTEDRIKYDRGNTDPYAYDVTLTSFNMVPSDSSIEGVALAAIRNITKEANVTAITAKTAEKQAAIVKKMISDIQNVKDYDKLVTYMTNQYKKNVEKFGASKY